jgi:small conductance mechanosensitive channel
VVPNAMLFKNAVDILTARPISRTTIVCGGAYDTDFDQAREIIEQAVSACPTVREQEPVQIFAQAFADSSINFEETWWTGAKPVDIRRSRDEVVRGVKRALDEAGIAIPFPQRTHWFAEPLCMESADSAE